MPRRDDIRSIMVDRLGADRDRSGVRVRLLGDAGVQGAPPRGVTRSSLVNSNPATIMTDPQFADRTYIEPLDPASVLAVLERERPDALLPTLGGQTGLNVAVALAESGDLDRLGDPADRREPGGDPSRGGPERVQADDARGRARGAAGGRRAHPRRGAGARRRDRLSGDRAAVVHARRRRQRVRSFARGARRPGAAQPGDLSGRRDPRRGVDRRLEGVRAGGHARRRRQRRDRVLDRERRSDGGAHRRLDHGGAGADAHRRGVPAHARRRAPMHPRDRRRDRRLQRAVRRASARRPDGPDRDEPARVAIVGAGVEGHRVPDREDRRAPRRRVPPGRDHERHHRRDARGVRADARLRGREDPAVRVREVPRRRPGADVDDEVGGRGHGDRAHVQGGARQGVAGVGEDASVDCGVRRHRCRSRRWRPPRRAGSRSWRPRSSPATRSRRSPSGSSIDPWFVDQIAQVVEGATLLRDRPLSTLRRGRAARGEAAGSVRSPDREPHTVDRRRRPAAPRGARGRAGLQDGRHVRGGVRGADAVPLLDVRGRDRGAAGDAAARA